MPSNRVTLADVAAKAGVAGKTVSRVVNGDGAVSEHTRERVEAAIRATGFRLNHAARALAASRSFLIGLFTPDVPSFYHAELHRAAARAARAHGYHLVIEEYDHRASSFVAQYESGLRTTGCDGIILPAPMSDDIELLDALDRDAVRHVRLAPATDVARSPSVFATDGDGVDELVRHLWAGGRRRFGIVTGPPSHASASIRRESFIEAVIAMGGTSDDVTVVQPNLDEPVFISSRHAAAKLLAESGRAAIGRPDAIFAFNDDFAAGVISVAHELGLRLPSDLAVAGFDDSDTARATWPALTSIRQPIDEVARRAVGALIRTVGGDATHEPVMLPVTLVIRESTGPVIEIGDAA